MAKKTNPTTTPQWYAVTGEFNRCTVKTQSTSLMLVNPDFVEGLAAALSCDHTGPIIKIEQITPQRALELAATGWPVIDPELSGTPM